MGRVVNTNQEPVVNAVIDIDNVLRPTVPSIVEYSNDLVDRAVISPKEFTLDSYVENFSELWGTDQDTTSEIWRGFCDERMPNLIPCEGMQSVFNRLPDQIALSALTSRNVSTKPQTSDWMRRYFPKINPVRHSVVDWNSNPQAHLATKADSLKHYFNDPSQDVDLMVDDEPKHAIGAAGIGVVGVLYGDYPWNKRAQENELVVWLPTPDLVYEFMCNFLEKKKKGIPKFDILKQNSTILM